MVNRYLFFMVIISSFIFSSDFNNNCVVCHTKNKVSLRKAFMDSILIYGGENNFKVGLFYYCKNPNKMTATMEESFVKKFLPLKPTALSDSELKKMINIYWNRYKIKGNLK